MKIRGCLSSIALIGLTTFTAGWSGCGTVDDEEAMAIAIEDCSNRLFQLRPIDCVDGLKIVDCLGEYGIGPGANGSELAYTLAWNSCTGRCNESIQKKHQENGEWYKSNCTTPPFDRERLVECEAMEAGCYYSDDRIHEMVAEVTSLIQVFVPGPTSPTNPGKPTVPGTTPVEPGKPAPAP